MTGTLTPPVLASLLLGSSDPDRLRAWYVAAFGIEPDVDGFLVFGSVAVLLDGRDDVGARTAEPGRVVLNYHVPDLQATARHLDGLGVSWVAPVERRDGGLWFATVEDPDGNYVQLIETTPDYWAQKAQRAGRAGPLDGATVAPRLPAQDLARARTFYRDVLGLEPVEEREGGLRYQCGDTTFVVFASTGRSSGTHTQLGISVPDLDLAVAGLRERGLVFDAPDQIVDVEGHYPSSGATGERAIWFHDSEGNLLGLGQLVHT